MLLDDAQKRHFNRWRILGRNVGTPEVDEQPTTYAGEIEKFKQWISKRLNWMDRNMPSFVVTGIEQKEVYDSQCILYPNPASSQLTIQSDKQIKEYTIYATTGKSMIVRINYPTSSLNLDTHDLKPGFYLVKVHFIDDSRWTGKFMKAN